ncbi:GNAT family N-acetyltransferase [Amycolatopsis sp. NPDC021455]|uniref:GNAT family N-acetyltransferase n=1 Tax=Amycolatopsis sp. NPDC021455 TaxID=3154901 RepID=UPI0033CEF7D7
MNTDDEITIETVPHADPKTIEATVDLGDLSRDTLGLLPRAVYADAAAKGCLLAARHRPTGRVVGYVLFRLPRDEVVLTHVCVDEAFRRAGIAKLMVDEVSRRHDQRQGLRAKCRDDYDIAATWRALGFTKQARTVGRGKDAAAMTVWWRDHGHPKLFTLPLVEPAIVTAAIDTNILMDLRIRNGQGSAKRSLVLKAPDLQDRVELVVPFGLERDLERQPEQHRARLLSEAQQHYRRPGSPPGTAEQIHDRMLTAITEVLPKYPATPQDAGDLWQLAETAAAGIQVFVTWDERLRNVIAPILLQLEDVPEVAQLRVLDPNRLYILLDELAHAAAYRPDSLEGTEFRSGRAGAGEETVLMAFLTGERGERRTDLRDRLGEFARTKKHHLIVRAPDGAPVACYATELDGGVLRVPLLRLADHATAGTVGRQLLWLLRKQARTSGAQVVEIEDPYLSMSFERIIGYESYQRVGQNWYAFVVDMLGTAAQVSAAASRAYGLVGLPPAPLIMPRADAATAAHYERAWWPAKLTDSELPHVTVAIKPTWSAELFGRPELLLSRRADIALGREQVYYRSGRGSALREPSRVVWYMSRSPTTGPGRFIGTSLLDGIDKGRPETLFATYSHYGVFRLSDIRAAATDGYAQALRLSDTELFASDVSRQAYDRLRKPLGGPQVPLSPTRISNQLFAELYAAGQRREDEK